MNATLFETEPFADVFKLTFWKTDNTELLRLSLNTRIVFIIGKNKTKFETQ